MGLFMLCSPPKSSVQDLKHLYFVGNEYVLSKCLGFRFGKQKPLVMKRQSWSLTCFSDESEPQAACLMQTLCTCHIIVQEGSSCVAFCCDMSIAESCQNFVINELGMEVSKIGINDLDLNQGLNFELGTVKWMKTPILYPSSSHTASLDAAMA